MISFNTVDYRSSIQPVMKVIKFAASYNTIFSKRKPARNAVRRDGNEYFANYWKEETENSPVKCES